LAFLWSALWLLHPFYVSVTTLTYHNDRFEIILYTFPDDLEKAVREKYGHTLNLDEPSEKDKNYMAFYMHEHLQLNLDGREIPYTFLGYTFENEKILLLAETEKFPLEGTLTVRQTWLTDIYPGQENIVHIILPDTKISEILDRKHPEIIVKL